MSNAHPNAELIDHLYASFRKRDAAAMAACYQPDATFSDPVFQVKGGEVADMWTMLCERGRDLTLDWRDVRADDATGAAHWEPRYTFSVTGRPVHNKIDARFTFRDGKIATHVDSFSLWRWTRMALGPKGAALGWAPFVQNAIRSEARRGLESWRKHRRP
jgi:ketosteroid isomerase-like protein